MSSPSPPLVRAVLYRLGEQLHADALLASEVKAEADKHKLLHSKQKPARVDRAPHVKGIAFDATSVLPPGVNIDIVAAACGFWRPYPITDAVHFQLR